MESGVTLRWEECEEESMHKVGSAHLQQIEQVPKPIWSKLLAQLAVMFWLSGTTLAVSADVCQEAGTSKCSPCHDRATSACSGRISCKFQLGCECSCCTCQDLESNQTLAQKREAGAPMFTCAPALILHSTSALKSSPQILPITAWLFGQRFPMSTHGIPDLTEPRNSVTWVWSGVSAFLGPRKAVTKLDAGGAFKLPPMLGTHRRASGVLLLG